MITKRFALISSIALMSFVLLSNVVKAEDSTTSGTTLRMERSEKIASREAEIEENHTLRVEARQEALSTFKANLQKIKDTRKQQIVENVQDRITNRNTLWVSHWNAVLKRLSAILDKIQTRTDEASKNGKDVSSVTAKIATARTSISTAQAAIDAQSSKTYTIDVSSEATIKDSTLSTITQFRKDVMSVITSINTARKSVVDVFTTISSIMEVKPSVTPVATATP